MHRIHVLTLTLAVVLLSCALVPATAAAIPRATVIARGKAWLKVVRVDPKTGARTIGVPYSQGAYALEDGSKVPTNAPDPYLAGYRTDCSGFVSMCLNLRDSHGRPYSTSTWEMGANTSALFKLRSVKRAELQPGDIMLKSRVWYRGPSGHAIIFAGWARADMSEYWALEQTGPKTTYRIRAYGQTGYRSFRYEGIEGFSRPRVTFGDTFTVTGTATRAWSDALGRHSAVATSGVVDLVYWSSAGTRSLLVADVPVNASGRFSIRYTPSRSGRYAVRFHSDAPPSRDVVFLVTDIIVTPYLTGVSGNLPTLRRNVTYRFDGQVNPRTTTRLMVYRYTTAASQYVYYRSVTAGIGSVVGSKGYAIAARWRPTLAGRYRLSWRTDAQGGRAAGVSATRYFGVK